MVEVGAAGWQLASAILGIVEAYIIGMQGQHLTLSSIMI